MKLISLALVVVTALATVGVIVSRGQQVPAPIGASGLAPDIQPTKSRMQKLDIDYKPEERKNIARIELVVSRDQGQTWEVMDAVTPDKDHLVFNGKDDGLYFLNMVIVFRNGTRDPKDVALAAPALKLLVDATAPVVKITNTQRVGEEVIVDWAIDEKYPNDAATQVLYKASTNPANEWLPILSSAINKRSARFKPSLNGPIAVRVMAQDLAGNVGDVAREVPVGITASYTPTNPPARPTPTLEPPTAPVPVLPTTPLVATSGLLLPTNPVTVPVEPAPIPPAPALPPNTQPAWAATPVGGVQQPVAPAPMPTPLTSAPPAPLPMATDHGFQPVATGSGISSQPTSAPANTQLINFTRFDLQYQLENGPSGISKIDLYVTRDEGRAWVRWSQHDSRETPLRVALDVSFNQKNIQIEGDYGFKLVPTSGAGLSDGAPMPGTPPELRVHVDLTPPLVEVGAPEPDPNQRNAMVLRWRITDRNPGKEQVLIEWSEQPNGPWSSVAASDSGTALVAGPIATTPTSQRVPNTGSYTWVLPSTLRTHKVYLRFSAWDAAGNKTEAANPQPFLVDPHKPKARIQGILTANVAPRP